MKKLLAILVVLVAFGAMGQERVKYNGLNRWVPDNVDIGMKFQSNYYFPQYIVEAQGATSSFATSNDQVGGGGGFYYRYGFTDHISLQTELNIHYRQGSVNSSRTYEVDTAIRVIKEDLSNYFCLFTEIPVYFKYRWSFIPLRQGHYKAKSALGVFIGPRAVITPYSTRDFAKSTETRAYEQESTSIETETTSIDPKASRFSPIAGMGIAAGVDYELWNGFIVHAAYYRGLLTHAIKSNGVRALDNRVEVGIGVRFK